MCRSSQSMHFDKSCLGGIDGSRTFSSINKRHVERKKYSNRIVMVSYRLKDRNKQTHNCDIKYILAIGDKYCNCHTKVLRVTRAPSVLTAAEIHRLA